MPLLTTLRSCFNNLVSKWSDTRRNVENAESTLLYRESIRINSILTVVEEGFPPDGEEDEENV